MRDHWSVLGQGRRKSARSREDRRERVQEEDPLSATTHCESVFDCLREVWHGLTVDLELVRWSQRL